MRIRFFTCLTVLFAWLLPESVPGAESAAPVIAVARPAASVTVEFDRDVLPALKDNCLACHNRTKAKADLVLETPADLLKGGETGPAIIPGKAAESLLLQVSTHAAKPRMPPPDNKVNAANLTPEQLGRLALWIDQGAKASARQAEAIGWQPVSDAFNAIFAVALSADGQFAACGRANRLFLYHVPSARLIAQLTDAATATNGLPATAHADVVNALAFNPTDDTLASGGFGEVKLWRRAETAPVPAIAPAAWPTNGGRSADGKRSVVVDTNHVARLLDGDGKLVAELRLARASHLRVAQAESWLTVTKQQVEAAKSAVEAAGKELSGQEERRKKAREAIPAADKALGEKLAPFAQARRDVALLEGQLARLEQRLAGDTNAAAARKPLQDKLEAARKQRESVEAEWTKLRRTRDNADNELMLAEVGVNQAGTARAAATWRLRNLEQAARQAEAALADVRREVDGQSLHSSAASISAEGSLVVTADEAGNLHLWSGADGRPLHSTATKLPQVDRLQITDGAVLAGNENATVRWEFLPTWTLARRLGTGDTRSPLVDRVNALAFSPDGRRLASGDGEPTRSGHVGVWDSSTGALLYRLENLHSDTVQALAFSPDGQWLASGGADRFARISETGSGRLVRSLEGHTSHVLGVAWKADGEVLATGGADYVVKLWNADRGERLKNIEGFGKEVTGLQFLGTTDQFLAASGAARIRVLNVKGEETGTLPAGSLFAHALAVSHDGTVAVGGGDDGILRIWSVNARQVLAELSPPAAPLAAQRSP